MGSCVWILCPQLEALFGIYGTFDVSSLALRLQGQNWGVIDWLGPVLAWVLYFLINWDVWNKLSFSLRHFLLKSWAKITLRPLGCFSQIFVTAVKKCKEYKSYHAGWAVLGSLAPSSVYIWHLDWLIISFSLCGFPAWLTEASSEYYHVRYRCL